MKTSKPTSKSSTFTERDEVADATRVNEVLEGLTTYLYYQKQKQFNKLDKLIGEIVLEKKFDIKQLVNSVKDFDEKEILEVIQWKLDNNELIYNKNHKIISTKKIAPILL